MWEKVAFVAVVLGMVVLESACGGGAGQPLPSLGKIQTADGQHSVTEVYVGDRFPPDCSTFACEVGPPDCDFCSGKSLKPGYQLVVVWLVPEFGKGEGALWELCSKSAQQMYQGWVSDWSKITELGVRSVGVACSEDEEREMYISSAEGSKGTLVRMKADFGANGPEVDILMFVAPVSAHGFTLFVPGNDPIDLGK